MRRHTALLIILLAIATIIPVACGDDSEQPGIDGDVDTSVDGDVDGDQSEEAEAQCQLPGDCEEGFDCRDGQCVQMTKCFRSNAECAADELCHKTDPDSPFGYCYRFCFTDADCPSNGQCENGVCEEYPALPESTPLKDGSETATQLMGNVATEPLEFPMGVTLCAYAARQGIESAYNDKMEGSNGVFERPYVKVLVLDNGTDQVIFVRVPLAFTVDYVVTGVVQRVIEATGKDVSRNIVMTSNHSHSLPSRFWNMLTGTPYVSLGLDDFKYEIYERIVDSIAKAVIKAQQDLKPVAAGWAINPDYDPDSRIAHDRRKTNNPIDGGSFKEPRMTVFRVDDMTDSADPQPLAVMVSFAVHGVITDWIDTYVTGDAGGGVEMAFEYNFEKETGKHIDAMFMQGAAGDVSPGGGQLKHEYQTKMMMLGTMAYKVARELYDGITPSRDMDLEIVSERLPIDTKHIGYADDEFFSYDIVTMGCEAQGLSTEECKSADVEDMAAAGCATLDMPFDYCTETCLMETEPYGQMRFGGFQCGLMAPVPEDEDADTKIYDGCMGCALKGESINGAPMLQMSKTRVSVIKFGNLLIGTLPGEPLGFTSNLFCDQLRDLAKEQTGTDDYEAIVFGYTNDHQFYLPLDDDWPQNGLETQSTMWGPKLTRYLVDSATEIAGQLFTDEREDNTNNVKATNYREGTLDKTWRVPTVTTDAVHGVVVDQPPAQYKRKSQMRFHFTGGDNGVDVPMIVLQKKNESDEFEDVYSEAGRRYDDQYYSIMSYWENPAQNDPFCHDCEDVNHWYITFEERKDFPLGDYRFKIEGHYYDGSTSVFERSGVKEYTAYTDAFAIMPLDNVTFIDVTVDQGVVSGSMSYPGAVSTDPGYPEPFEKLTTKSIVLHNTVTPPYIGDALAADDTTVMTMTLTPAAGGDAIDLTAPVISAGEMVRNVVASRSVDPESSDVTETLNNLDGKLWPVTNFTGNLPDDLTAGEYTLDIAVTDVWGNTGAYQTTITVE